MIDAIDLQEGLDVARASMTDFADAVVRAAARLPGPCGLLGWSLGGLSVLMAAERVRPAFVVLLESSPPLEVQGADAGMAIVDGSFDAEQLYGRFPPGLRARSESLRARSERKRGISVPSLPCPSLVVYGSEFAEERGRRLVTLYGSDELAFPNLDHWGLVIDPRPREAIAAWILQPV